MATVLLEDHEQIEIPTIHNLAEFRRWALSGDFPERGRIDYVAGKIEVNLAPNEIYTHVTVMTEVACEIHRHVDQLDAGHTFASKTRISSPVGNFSVEPDVLVVTYHSLDDGSLKLIPKASGEKDRYVEVEGGPDLVVEIVSDSSVQKDTERLPVAYYKAGVREYWLIDARGEELSFQILRRGKTAFEATPADAEGYQRSDVLNAVYRLDRNRHQRGHWVYHLRLR